MTIAILKHGRDRGNDAQTRMVTGIGNVYLLPLVNITGRHDVQRACLTSLRKFCDARESLGELDTTSSRFWFGG